MSFERWKIEKYVLPQAKTRLQLIDRYVIIYNDRVILTSTLPSHLNVWRWSFF